MIIMLKVSCLNIDGTPLDNLVQWDIGKQIMLPDIPTLKTPLVYFYNKILREDEAISVVSRQDINGNVVVDVPNFLLQKPYPLVVRVCDSGENTVQTVAIAYISVKATNKPSDYEYVENVTYTTLNVFYDDVDAEIQRIIYGIKDGSPKGAFTNISELNGKPSGIYVNATNGYIYYWNNETLSDPIVQYQSTGIADGSVAFSSLSKELQSKCRNHVRGFRSQFSFNIETTDKNTGEKILSVAFTQDEGAPGSPSFFWIDDTYRTVPATNMKTAYAAYENQLSGHKHMVLMHSNKNGFYWSELSSFTEVTQDNKNDFVIMFIHLLNDVVQYIIACDDVLNKILVDGEKYTNTGSIEESVQAIQDTVSGIQNDIVNAQGQIADNTETITANKYTFDTTYRNHVLGFKSSHNFYIDTESQEVTFMPESTSVIYGNNTSAYIYRLTETVGGASVTGAYTASYAEFLSGTQTTNIIMLMYSPNAEIRKSAFYFKQFDKNQITNDDYVVMILRINQDGVLYAVACDDILDKIYVGKSGTYTKHINPDSIQEAIMNAQGQIADNAEAIANRLNRDTFYSAYRNHVRGFKSSYNFYINTTEPDPENPDVSGRFVTFKPSTTSTMWGNNIFANIPAITEKVGEETVVHEYTASYSEFLSNAQSNIIMLMYSPTLGSANNDISVRKSAFYFKPFNHSQVTDNDYVIMVLHVNTAGVAYIIACDDVLNRVYVGKGTDISSYVPYAVDLTATTAAVERELTQARYSYYDNNTHESLAKHLYSTDTALKNHIAQYRNHCRSYIGNMYLDINTDEITMKVNIPSTGRAYGDNGFVNITKNSGSEDGAYTVNGMDVITLSDNVSTILALFYSSTSKEFYIKLFGATSQPKSTNDLFMCAMRVVAIENNDGNFTIRVDEIVGCDDIISAITVNGVKWMPGYVENHNTCSIFSRVCCIGDSATAGHIDCAYNSEGVLPTDLDPDLNSSSVQLRRNEKHAWPAFMAKSTGNEYINLGISGATALTWLNDAVFNNTDKTIYVKSSWLATGYDENGKLVTGAFETLEEKTDTNGETKYHIVYERTVENTDTISAYLIGLGMNDTLNIGTEGNRIDGGTGTPKLALCEDKDDPAADIGTGRETFYGKYSELIEKIHAVSPAAHIFVQTMHDNMNDRRVLYNEAIRYIANYYSTRENDPIPVHVLDLYKYQNLYNVDSIRNDKLGGHWSPISYQQFAENLKRVWSDYLNAHPSEFTTVHLIPQELTPEEELANMRGLIKELTERINELESSQTN